MNTEQELFGSYLGLSVKQRIYHLMKNYHYRDRYVECYRQYIEGMIADIRAYECRPKDDIGVRIMSGDNNSDATARLAEDAVKISNVFITGHIGESLIKDKEERRVATLAVMEWMTIRDDYAALNRALMMLRPEDNELIMDFLNKKKSYYDIADEGMLTYNAAKKKLQRIRRKVVKLTEHDFERHNKSL